MYKFNNMVTALATTAAIGASSLIAAPAAQVVRVDAKKVCMVNEASMSNDQIPVKVEGKTYYGCCAMCKERLEKDAAIRSAIDPVSGKTVDKATAVIGALPGGKVLYFESDTNLKKYNARAAVQNK